MDYKIAPTAEADDMNTRRSGHINHASFDGFCSLAPSFPTFDRFSRLNLRLTNHCQGVDL